MVGKTGAVTLSYDPLGRLYRTQSAALGKTDMLYDGDELVAEYDGDTLGMRRRYMFGPGVDEPILWDEGASMNCSATRFLHTDYQGSVIALADCYGNRTNANQYDEFGIPAASSFYTPGAPQRFGYTGQAWLPELGMWYYKTRLYAPTLGRFMQTDPIGYGDGMNWYNYVKSDPINGRDPSGLLKIFPPPPPPPPPPPTGPGTEVTVTGKRLPKCDALCELDRDLGISALKENFGRGPALSTVGQEPQNDPDHGCPAGTTYKAMTPNGPNCQAPPAPPPPPAPKRPSRFAQCLANAIENYRNGVSFSGSELAGRDVAQVANGLIRQPNGTGGVNVIESTTQLGLLGFFNAGNYIARSCAGVAQE